MQKVRRAGKTTASRTSNKRRKAQAKPRQGTKWLTNWLAAQSRAARNRLSYLFKLTAVTLAGIAALTLGVLTVFGQLDDAGSMLAEQAEHRIAKAGYTVQWLDIAGTNRLTADDLAVLVGADSRLALSQVDLSEVKTILEQQSWVESAEVMRLWPNRIAIVIEEREPFALWQHNEVHYVIDYSGAVIDDANPAEFADLPRVVGHGANEFAGSFLTILAFHTELYERTTHILRIGERRWSLRLSNGGEVLLPQSDEASALATLSALHNERGVLDYDAQLIDMRNPGEMVLRPWPDRAAEHAGRGA